MEGASLCPRLGVLFFFWGGGGWYPCPSNLLRGILLKSREAEFKPSILAKARQSDATIDYYEHPHHHHHHHFPLPKATYNLFLSLLLRDAKTSPFYFKPRLNQARAQRRGFYGPDHEAPLPFRPAFPPLCPHPCLPAIIRPRPAPKPPQLGEQASAGVSEREAHPEDCGCEERRPAQASPVTRLPGSPSEQAFPGTEFLPNPSFAPASRWAHAHTPSPPRPPSPSLQVAAVAAGKVGGVGPGSPFLAAVPRLVRELG